MTGRNVRMVWTLDGPMDRADYAYRLTSPQVAFDKTGFLDVRAEGRGKLSPWPMRVPLLLKARAITGVGDVAGGILANISIEGMLPITPKLVRGEKLKLRSARLNGTLSLLIDLKTGRFDVAISGGLKRYLIPGLGIVDVETQLKVVPGPGGKGSRVIGKAQAWVRRLDNSFFAGLTGGLPRLTTDLERGRDGIVHFTNLQLYSPKLRLSGQGIRRRDGTFLIEARGRQEQYGPLRMRLDGKIERPKVELFLERPNEALGIRDMTLFLDPNAQGFALSRQRPVAAGAVHVERTNPAPARRAGDDRHRRARCRGNDGARRAAVRSGRVHRRAAAGRRRDRRDARLRPVKWRAEDRSASDREQCRLARAAEAGGAVGTRRRDDHPGGGAHHARRRADRARADDQRDHAGAGHGQCEAGQRHRPGARRAGGDAADRVRAGDAGQCDARPDQRDRTRPARPAAADAGKPGGDHAGRGRLADRADAGALRRRAGDTVGPDRRPARVPRRYRADAAATARYRLAEGGAGRDRQRADRLSLGRAADGKRQPARARPDARGAGACVEADRCRRQCRAERRPRGDAGGGGQRRQDDRPGAGAVLRRWDAGRSSPS